MNLNRLARILILLALSNTFVLAQSGSAPRRGMPNYDLKTEITVKGTIEEVQQQAGRRGWGSTHLLLKTDAETLDVHLGPTQYISEQGFSFAKGDQIEVTGSKVKMAGADALIARELKKSGKTLTLRDSQGVPKWSRARRGPQS